MRCTQVMLFVCCFVLFFVVGCKNLEYMPEDDDVANDDDIVSDDDDTTSGDDDVTDDDDITSDDDTTSDDDDTTPGDDDVADDDDITPGDDDSADDDDSAVGDDDVTPGDDDDTTSDDDDSTSDDDTTPGDDDTSSDDDDSVDDDDTTPGDDDDTGDDDTISDDDSVGDDDTSDDDDDSMDDDDTTGDDDDTLGDDDSADDDDSAGDDDDSSDDDDSVGDDDTTSDDDDTTGDDDDDTVGGSLEIAVVDTGSSGIIPIQTTLGNAGHNVTLLDYNTVSLGIDPSFDLLIYPGGIGGVWEVVNQPSLGTAIRDFVAAGHGFIGICGGAIVGSTDLDFDGWFLPGVMVGLLDVEATWYSDWSYYVGNMTSLQFEVAIEHTVLAGYQVGDPFTGDYAGGPTLASMTEDIYLNYNEDLDPGLAVNVVSGSGALSIGEYYLGKVILSSIHPEYNYPDSLLAYIDWVSP